MVHIFENALDFKRIGSLDVSGQGEDPRVKMQNFDVLLKEKEIQYVQIIASNTGHDRDNKKVQVAKPGFLPMKLY
jgi:hypothetical protein